MRKFIYEMASLTVFQTRDKKKNAEIQEMFYIKKIKLVRVNM